jgi:DNA-directed RNA polymerase subunit RPC12/RpoP
MVLEAKCPQCDKRAEVDEEMIEVNCKHCGFRVRYDEYVEIKKSSLIKKDGSYTLLRSMI